MIDMDSCKGEINLNRELWVCHAVDFFLKIFQVMFATLFSQRWLFKKYMFHSLSWKKVYRASQTTATKAQYPLVVFFTPKRCVQSENMAPWLCKNWSVSTSKNMFYHQNISGKHTKDYSELCLQSGAQTSSSLSKQKDMHF